MARDEEDRRTRFDTGELGAVAHLYRGEVYRSTIWRTRLDTTTNWSVVTLGIALSISFASPAASPLPLILVGILIVFFLMLEARRYRYFNVWRARCRWMERHFFAPLLTDGEQHLETGWQTVLAEDYRFPRYHVPMRVAVGRRIRRNYIWILLIQSAAYAGKLMVHPGPLTSARELYERAAIGPVDGRIVIVMGCLYVLSWALAAVASAWDDRRRAAGRAGESGMG
ncbi:DUF2270 domain-containing protein [Sinirhodobacter ferrireducens]|uniref:DUF2270 domain-containing protein n=1 Tax=Paenirhodobacter ferrireducens TaxID=1215032 RepID=A0A443LVB9_9RHOB|nr:DUF2270 domain-containing protein [Sinirhodobacter ferrireducens]RWR53124.1 DUF2270 domain-containing protein [Sinirhodobacter ferrireducens]